MMLQRLQVEEPPQVVQSAAERLGVRADWSPAKTDSWRCPGPDEKMFSFFRRKKSGGDGDTKKRRGSRGGPGEEGAADPGSRQPPAGSSPAAPSQAVRMGNDHSEHVLLQEPGPGTVQEHDVLTQSAPRKSSAPDVRAEFFNLQPDPDPGTWPVRSATSPPVPFRRVPSPPSSPRHDSKYESKKKVFQYVDHKALKKASDENSIINQQRDEESSLKKSPTKDRLQQSPCYESPKTVSTLSDMKDIDNSRIAINNSSAVLNRDINEEKLKSQNQIPKFVSYTDKTTAPSTENNVEVLNRQNYKTKDHIVNPCNISIDSNQEKTVKSENVLEKSDENRILNNDVQQIISTCEREISADHLECGSSETYKQACDTLTKTVVQNKEGVNNTSAMECAKGEKTLDQNSAVGNNLDSSCTQDSTPVTSCIRDREVQGQISNESEGESVQKGECVNGDEKVVEANERREEKCELEEEPAKSCADARTDIGDDAISEGEAIGGEGGMHRINTYPLSGDGEQLYLEELKGGLFGTSGVLGLVRSAGGTDLRESSDEESEESEESDEEGRVVKNDSGCWDEPERSPSKTSILCVGDWRRPRAKKSVKWKDIDGQAELTEEKEGTPDFLLDGVLGEEQEEPKGGDSSSSGEEDEDEEDEGSSESEGETEAKVEASDTAPEGESESEEEDSSSDEEETVPTGVVEDGGITAESAVSKVESAVSRDERTPNGADVEGSDGTSGEDDSDNSTSGSSDEEEPHKEPVKPEPQIIKVDVQEMQRRIAELQKDIENKTTNIDRLQVELDTACNESEKVRQRFQRLEADLEQYRQTNKELAERLQITEIIEEEKIIRSTKQLSQAEQRIKDLETELRKVKEDYSSIQTSYKKLQADRDMEVQIIQKALEKALSAHEETEQRYEREFEELRSNSSAREAQMLEDFEWKLREVERNAKKKLNDYEAEYEQKNLLLAQQLASAQVDLQQIAHLKLCEVELNQLKQTSSEQRKNLRLLNRKLEELQVSEKILQEEVSSLRSSLDKEKAHIVQLQTMHKEDLAEKERKMKIKMDIQIKQVSNEWAERLRIDTNKIKTDMEKLSREEKKVAVDLANKLKDQEIFHLKQAWEKKEQEYKCDIAKYKNKINEMEEKHKQDINNAQTNSDRDIFDLRRKLDKIDMSYQEKIEKLEAKHEAEVAKLKEECERKQREGEAALQMQSGNSRATLELVKQQLRNESQARVDRLEYEHQRKLEDQRAALEKEKENALLKLEESHQKALDGIYREIETSKKLAWNEQDQQSRRRTEQPPSQPIRQNSKSKIPESENNGSSNFISPRLEAGNEAEGNPGTLRTEELLHRSIQDLTKELNAGKMEIEKLKQELERRNQQQPNQQQKGGGAPRSGQQPQSQQQQGQQQKGGQQQQQGQQQKGGQQPVPNPRRNRKGRLEDCYLQ